MLLKLKNVDLSKKIYYNQEQKYNITSFKLHRISKNYSLTLKITETNVFSILKEAFIKTIRF